MGFGKFYVSDDFLRHSLHLPDNVGIISTWRRHGRTYFAVESPDISTGLIPPTKIPVGDEDVFPTVTPVFTTTKSLNGITVEVTEWKTSED